MIAHTHTVTGFLRAHGEPISRFVLLDHMDWLGAHDAAALAEEWEMILARAAPTASADIFIFPSVTETFGNVTMEAMASGLAVVAYNYAAAEEHMRHDHNGLMAPVDDSEAFLRLVAELTNDRERIRRLAVNARLATEQIDWAAIVGELERVLPDMAGTHAPAAASSDASGSSTRVADAGT